MSNAAHTPGPWAVIRPEGSANTLIYGGGGTGAKVAHLYSGHDGELIAAAPAMLAALQAIEAYEDSEPAPGTREAEIAQMRRAAIAAATGDPTSSAPIATGDAIALLRCAVEAWGEDMDSDEPIAGSDAVEWLCGFIRDARDVLGDSAPTVGD